MYKNFNKYDLLRFSGHQSFPLTYGWLPKFYKAVLSNNASKTVNIDNEISNLGMGKNMILSARYWAKSCEFTLDNLSEVISNTSIAKLILDQENGYDKFLENVTSLWLIHWDNEVFTKENLLEDMKSLCQTSTIDKIQTISSNSINKDVESLIKNYSKRLKSRDLIEDRINSSILSELNLSMVQD